ncbi:MAG TPA: SAM-dependent methyltransferase [Candidatus Kerfeldbacteria bacterium]|nr:SAM-dependent methyltransferase [Candidatus Kerfeldbacteria bacterium]
MRTDWNKVAKWYGEHLRQDDTFQSRLIFPRTLQLLNPIRDKLYLDIACGEGSFAQLLTEQYHAKVVGFDLAAQLIQQAKRKRLQGATFQVGDAIHFPTNILKQSFDGATCVLALQNIANYSVVIQQTAQILKPQAPLVLVLNHPHFRPPKQSGWGFDEQRQLQYRRVDTYLSPYEVSLEAHPGKKHSVKTVSFHRPLQDYVQALTDVGLLIDAIEEWVSDRSSQPGARARAENRARTEFPLFMAIRARKQ